MRRHLIALCACSILTLSALPVPAWAGLPTPYKGAFEFSITSIEPQSPSTILVKGVMEGVETVLGQFQGEVEYLIDLNTGTYVGDLTKTGNDGDELDETLVGSFTETGGIGTFEVVGGTGRFAGATGSGTFVNTWTNDEMTEGDVTFDGTIDRGTEGNFEASGAVFFTNVQAATQVGGIAPYIAAGRDGTIGKHVQLGSIRNLSGLIPIDATTFIFYGEVGPNPFLAGHPEIHVIDTRQGQIHCTWTALFTLEIVNENFDAVFRGDGEFEVIGGTRQYRTATGHFTTLFESEPVPAGHDRAVAGYQQIGDIQR